MRQISRYLLGPLDVDVVKGDHGSLFQEPNIRVLTEHINRHLVRDREA